jgi:hypothetical protein
LSTNIAEGDGSRWERRRQEIVDTAATLFARKGYNGTGVVEICDAVGLGKGSLYYYIESKENLLTLIHDRVMAEVLESGDSVVSLEASAGGGGGPALPPPPPQPGGGFHIVDYILSVTGSTVGLGNRPGADARAGKTTYTAVLGVDGSRERAAGLLAAALDELNALGLAQTPLAAVAAALVQRTR